jgi:hypothetical protein
MAADLKDQIHALMERGVQPVSAADIASRQSARSSPFPVRNARRPASWSKRTAVIATGAVAACAAGIVAAQFGGSGTGARPGSTTPVRQAPAMLTAAMLRHLTAASRLALAQSGRATVTSREVLAGKLQQTGTDDITFDGRNWNDSFTVTTPAAAGQPASRESAINRVVDGRAYDYFVAADGLAWYHDVGPDAVANLAIPDPRTLLGELAPAARFAKRGTSALGGVAVTKLTATNVGGLPTLDSPDIWPTGRISALSIWVDRQGVVRQVTVTGTQIAYVGTFASGKAAVRQQLSRFLAQVSDLERRDHLTRAQALERVKFLVLGREQRRLYIQGFRTEADVTTMTIRFTDIGQPQTIRAPAHAIRVYGRG